MSGNVCLPVGYMLLLFLSGETAAGTGGQNLGITAGTAKSLQGNRGKAFFSFVEFLDRKPHWYVCHRNSNSPALKKLGSWHGDSSWGVGSKRESESYFTETLLLEACISYAQELPSVKARKKCHSKETQLCGHLACKYICAHICAGIQRYRSLTSLFWRWSKVSITSITAV